MKHNIPLSILAFAATALVTEHRFVTIKSGGVAVASASDPVIGVSGRGDVEAGGVVDVVTAGFIPVAYGEAIVIGDRLGVGSDGKAVKSASGKWLALEAGQAGYVGSVIAVLS